MLSASIGLIVRAKFVVLVLGPGEDVEIRLVGLGIVDANLQGYRLAVIRLERHPTEQAQRCDIIIQRGTLYRDQANAYDDVGPTVDNGRSIATPQVDIACQWDGDLAPHRNHDVLREQVAAPEQLDAGGIDAFVPIAASTARNCGEGEELMSVPVQSSHDGVRTVLHANQE